MLTDEIMYICIKQNIKYAKVQATTKRVQLPNMFACTRTKEWLKW